MKKIAILGSTGSIGESTLKVARHLKETIRVTALAAHSNIDLLEKQAKEFHPELIAVFDEKKALDLKKRLPEIEIAAGMEGLKAVASYSGADFVVSAMSGTAGLVPTVAAIEAGKTIGLANKEALVSGGALVMALAKRHGVQILPIDSEHSALFQCLQGQAQNSVSRLILTASGGPFRNFTQEQINAITPEQALCHPTWTMGAKITVDCSTLMNKGLEVIEAHWLFNIPIENISVVVHPQSIIHSMVEFVDGSLLAQMGESSMIVPIQYALTYPERKPGLLKPFDFVKYNTLQFLTPDVDKFRCLQLAFDATRAGGSMPCYMNAANEVLVNSFLEKKIAWNEIPKKLESLMEKHATQPVNSIDDILLIDAQARNEASCKRL
ncbi:MAG TPA: 1-deoxy-D-xylulose-5-phosphate reductoisomerase [Parachlamydiaceae bacterium]|nr:1-deoxy-D-xylulose-5-phosphate reductoisomerase [Parachlamydiaceae bacterium]